MQHKDLVILGSTGSIGTSGLDVVRHLPGKFRVRGLAARCQIDLLEKQALEFDPELIAVYDTEAAKELQSRLPHIRVVSGMEGLLEVARLGDAGTLLSALTGTVGILPTYEAIKAGKRIALANKEVLVSAGKVIMNAARAYGVEVIPVDSEHSALFQCLVGEEAKGVSRLILTASGGPFRGLSADKLEKVTLKEALCHPTWSMGVKNTIDSSTLMNKGLEMIEAHYLFDVPVKDIDVVVHPQSVVHSFVEFVDRSMLAQCSMPDMKLPIQYALTYPTRMEGTLEPFDFTRTFSLDFAAPDMDAFRCLKLAYAAVTEGGSMPCFMNAANEVLVNRFAAEQISWSEIGQKLETLMEKHQSSSARDLDEILQIDQQARDAALII